MKRLFGGVGAWKAYSARKAIKEWGRRRGGMCARCVRVEHWLLAGAWQQGSHRAQFAYGGIPESDQSTGQDLSPQGSTSPLPTPPLPYPPLPSHYPCSRPPHLHLTASPPAPSPSPFRSPSSLLPPWSLEQVTIDLANPQEALEEELSDPEYTKPSAMVDNSDDVIVDLAHQIDDGFARAGYKLAGRGETIEARLQMDVSRFAACTRTPPSYAAAMLPPQSNEPSQPSTSTSAPPRPQPFPLLLPQRSLFRFP